VGLVARKIEEAGVATVTLNMLWPYQRLIGMPRLAAVEHPFGRPFGEVGDAETQKAVLRAALALYENAIQPGHVQHLPFVWHEDPKETDWHPPEPSPIIAWFKEQTKKQQSGEQT
jgi:D-proline reductase (dithiol) PrdB